MWEGGGRWGFHSGVCKVRRVIVTVTVSRHALLGMFMWWPVRACEGVLGGNVFRCFVVDRGAKDELAGLMPDVGMGSLKLDDIGVLLWGG